MKNCNTILTEKKQKYQHYRQLSSDQSRIIEQDKFIYSPSGKTFEKQTKTIEEQGKNK